MADLAQLLQEDREERMSLSYCDLNDVKLFRSSLQNLETSFSVLSLKWVSDDLVVVPWWCQEHSPGS